MGGLGGFGSGAVNSSVLLGQLSRGNNVKALFKRNYAFCIFSLHFLRKKTIQKKNFNVDLVSRCVSGSDLMGAVSQILNCFMHIN